MSLARSDEMDDPVKIVSMASFVGIARVKPWTPPPSAISPRLLPAIRIEMCQMI
jgi:hypothetical protein